MIFNNKAQDLVKLLDYVKFMSFLWLKASLLTSIMTGDGTRYYVWVLGSSFLLVFISCALWQ